MGAHPSRVARERTPRPWLWRPATPGRSGGGARSQTWSQILLDVTGARMIIAVGSQFGALGAAITAGVGVGLYPDYANAVERCVRIERVHEPDPERVAFYDERYVVYRDLGQAMQP